MSKADSTEIYLSGYLQALVGKEFTQENYNVVFSHFDEIIHENHAETLEMIDLMTVDNKQIDTKMRANGF